MGTRSTTMSTDGYTNLDQQKHDEWLARQSDADFALYLNVDNLTERPSPW